MPSNNRRLFILPLHLLTCHITESSYPFSIGCVEFALLEAEKMGWEIIAWNSRHTLELTSRFSNVFDLAFFVKKLQNLETINVAEMLAKLFQ
jgi:hypothetical protein